MEEDQKDDPTAANFLKNLPPSVSTVLKKLTLNKNDSNTLRQFLHSRACHGMNIDPLLDYIRKRYGKLTALRIWTVSDQKKAEAVHKSSKQVLQKVKKQPASTMPKKRPDFHKPEEMREYLSSVEPSNIDGCKLEANGKYVLTKKGKAFVRQVKNWIYFF